MAGKTVDPHDELFEDDFDGSWEPLEPFDTKPLTKLPPAAADIIGRRLGIDILDDECPLGHKAAAAEWFWRRAAGQKVTFRQVMRGGSLLAMFTGVVEEVDPTPEQTPTSSDG